MDKNAIRVKVIKEIGHVFRDIKEGYFSLEKENDDVRLDPDLENVVADYTVEEILEGKRAEELFDKEHFDKLGFLAINESMYDELTDEIITLEATMQIEKSAEKVLIADLGDEDIFLHASIRIL